MILQILITIFFTASISSISLDKTIKFNNAHDEIIVITSPGCEHCKKYHDEHISPLIEKVRKMDKKINIRIVPFFTDPFSLTAIKACCIYDKKYFWELFYEFLNKQEIWKNINPREYKGDEDAWNAFTKIIIDISMSKLKSMGEKASSKDILNLMEDENLENQWLEYHSEKTKEYKIFALPTVFIKNKENKIRCKFNSPPKIDELLSKIR